MQGSRFDDLWPTVRRILVQPPNRVPSGLRVVWFLFWLLIGQTIWAFIDGPFSDIDLSDLAAETLVRTLLGGGLVAMALVYAVAHILPGWKTGSFVDVVRFSGPG